MRDRVVDRPRSEPPRPAQPTRRRARPRHARDPGARHGDEPRHAAHPARPGPPGGDQRPHAAGAGAGGGGAAGVVKGAVGLKGPAQ